MCFKKDKELYSRYQPPRRKLIGLVLVQMLLAVIFGCWIPICVVILQSPLLATLCGALSAACIAWLVYSWRKCNRDELALCKKEYAYFWKKEFADGREFETIDEETGVRYIVKREGLQVIFPAEKDVEQIFEEVEENVLFLPWSDTRWALATQKRYFMAKFALAILDVGTLQTEEDGVSYEEPFILPMSEQLICAVKSFHLEEKTCGYWAYLLYNPDDAVKQVYQRGYIKDFRDKKTGKKIPLRE